MTSTTTALTLAVFALTYLLIAFRRIPVLPIGRPAGALLGATLMAVCGALRPAKRTRPSMATPSCCSSARCCSRRICASPAFLSWRRRCCSAVPARPSACSRWWPSRPRDASDEVPRSALVLPSLVVLGVVAGFSMGLHLGFTALSGALMMMILSKRDPREALAHVDWPLLVFFAALFIVMGAVGKTGLARDLMSAAAPHMNLEHAAGVSAFTGVMTLGSNVFSNVPLVLLAGPALSAFGDAQLGWALLAFVTTIAGNLTLVGSVANLIVAESARSHYKLGFIEYLRFGAISTGVCLAVGVPIVCALTR